MKVQSIAAATGMGTVDLAVTDADRALRFYRDYVGLTPLPGDGPEVHMGAAGRQLAVLHPGVERPVVPRTSGLYHLAIVVPDRRELARVISRLALLRWDQYPTDHPGFVRGYWTEDAETGKLHTFIVFDDEAGARFLKGVVEANSQAQARVGISYDSLSIAEIKASASRQGGWGGASGRPVGVTLETRAIGLGLPVRSADAVP